MCDLKARGGATVDPMLADTLLDRALVALGGPVEDRRPQVVTVVDASLTAEALLAAAGFTGDAGILQNEEVPFIPPPGRIDLPSDPGDECDPLEYRP